MSVDMAPRYYVRLIRRAPTRRHARPKQTKHHTTPRKYILKKCKYNYRTRITRAFVTHEQRHADHGGSRVAVRVTMRVDICNIALCPASGAANCASRRCCCASSIYAQQTRITGNHHSARAPKVVARAHCVGKSDVVAMSCVRLHKQVYMKIGAQILTISHI